MSHCYHPKGTILRGNAVGETRLIPCDVPMGHPMRRYLERTTRLIEGRSMVRSKKGGKK